MSSGAAAEPEKRRKVPVWAETIILIVLALAVSAVVKTFFVQMFFVPSGSMKPLLVDDDRILVEKISYWGEARVERGDVVVFEDPGGKWLGPLVDDPTVVQRLLTRVGLYPAGGHLVKRVIGVGGDEVMCCDDKGRVRVNGVPLDEKDFLAADAKPSSRRFDVKVPENRIWVMGDNRPDSEDSRFHQDLPGGGTVPESSVVGKVWAVVWPVSRFDRLETPATFTRPDLTVTGERP
ncbi:MAG: signal peptidase I [Nocardioides sp.]